MRTLDVPVTYPERLEAGDSFSISDFRCILRKGHDWQNDSEAVGRGYTHSLKIEVPIRRDTKSTTDFAASVASVLSVHFDVALVYNKEFLLSKCSPGHSQFLIAQAPLVSDVLRQRGMLEAATALEEDVLRVGSN